MYDQVMPAGQTLERVKQVTLLPSIFLSTDCDRAFFAANAASRQVAVFLCKGAGLVAIVPAIEVWTCHLPVSEELSAANATAAAEANGKQRSRAFMGPPFFNTLLCRLRPQFGTDGNMLNITLKLQATHERGRERVTRVDVRVRSLRRKS